MDVQVDRVKLVVFPDGRVDTENAARFLGLSPKTLAIMRSNGSGPKFIKRGRIFYFLDDLKDWITDQPRVRSSAQARTLGRSS